VRHRVIVAAEMWRQPRGPVAAELFQIVEEEKADLIVAGGYGHSRLAEWIFGGVTRELLAATLFVACCRTEHRRCPRGSAAGMFPIGRILPRPITPPVRRTRP
jgi:hypothetical protein